MAKFYEKKCGEQNYVFLTTTIYLATCSLALNGRDHHPNCYYGQSPVGTNPLMLAEKLTLMTWMLLVWHKGIIFKLKSFDIGWSWLTKRTRFGKWLHPVNIRSVQVHPNSASLARSCGMSISVTFYIWFQKSTHMLPAKHYHLHVKGMKALPLLNLSTMWYHPSRHGGDDGRLHLHQIKITSWLHFTNLIQ